MGPLNSKHYLLCPIIHLIQFHPLLPKKGEKGKRTKKGKNDTQKKL